MSLNPLSTILSSNKLEGDNYVDWKRNLDIVLTVDKHKWVLTTPVLKRMKIRRKRRKTSWRPGFDPMRLRGAIFWHR